MDFLKQQLERRQKEREQLKSDAAKVVGITGAKKKYVRNGDLERVALLQQQMENEERERERKRPKHSSSQPQEQKSKLQAGEAAVAEEKEEKEELLMPKQQVFKILRQLGQPVTLFGESMRDRQSRMRKLQEEAAGKSDTALAGEHAIRNEFLERNKNSKTKDSHDDHDEHDDDDDDHTPKSSSNKEKAKSHHSDKEAAADGEAKEEDEQDLDDHMKIYRFFKTMLKLWEIDLQARPEHIKRTAKGKLATKTMKQCKDYIRPLFKLCKKKEVPDDILPKLVEIVQLCKTKEFRQAGDIYFLLTIGNAAWPIGVTMVGIHERTGREKINTNKTAHIMNNEMQRKYLTSVKRLITYAQSKANADPSKSLLN